MNETRRGMLLGGLCGIANWITGRVMGLRSEAAEPTTTIIEAVNFDADGHITPLAKQPELFGKTPPNEWGCFKNIQWSALGNGLIPWNGDTVLIFGGGIALAQIFHDRYTDDLHYRGVNCKYGPMGGMFMLPYVTHWAIPTWPTFAQPIKSCAWLPEWWRLCDEAPVFNREVLVQFENGSTMAAKLVRFEFDNTIRQTADCIEAIPGGIAIVDSRSKPTYIFETLDGAQIMNRVKLWAYFRGESLRLNCSPKRYQTLAKLEPIAVDGPIESIGWSH